MRFLCVFILISLCICTYGDFKENYMQNKKKIWRNSRTSITSPGKTEDFYNATVYLGYANNPFGPSTRVLRKEVKPLHNQMGYNKYTKNFMVLPENENANFQEQRSKRGVVHLYNMVSCATGCNPLIYKGYGCYCGFLGSGYAVDGIDRCCKLHDLCYDTANCPSFLEYFVPYFWKCYHNTPLCAIRQEQWGGPKSCARKLCECDRLLSECLSRFPCPSSRAVCKSSPWRLLQNKLTIL